MFFLLQNLNENFPNMTTVSVRMPQLMRHICFAAKRDSLGNKVKSPFPWSHGKLKHSVRLIEKASVVDTACGQKCRARKTRNADRQNSAIII